MTEYLYRHWSGGTLLYVGISANPFQRTKQHMSTSQWRDEVDRITIERFGNRREVELAEIVAIQNERPLFNRRYSPYVTAPKVASSIPSPVARADGSLEIPVGRSEAARLAGRHISLARDQSRPHGFQRGGKDRRWWYYPSCVTAWAQGVECPHERTKAVAA